VFQVGCCEMFAKREQMEAQPHVGTLVADVDSRAVDVRVPGVGDRGDRLLLLGPLAPALAFQAFLSVDVAISRSQPLPPWLGVALESFAAFLGLSIAYLSVELSRIKRVRYPLVIATAFGSTSVVSCITAIAGAEGSIPAEFVLSTLTLDDLSSVGQYVLAVPLVFLPLALAGEHTPDQRRIVSVLVVGVVTVLAGALLLGSFLENPGDGLSPSEVGHPVYGRWFGVSIAFCCVMGIVFNLRSHCSSNRLIFATSIVLATIGLIRIAQLLPDPVNWFGISFARLAELGAYVVFALVLLGEHVRGYRESVATSGQMKLELQQKASQLHTLMECARFLDSTPEANEVQAKVLQAAVQLVNGSGAMLAVYDEGAGILIPRQVLGRREVFPASGFPPNEGITGRVFSTQRAEFVPDVTKDPQAIIRSLEGGPVSMMSVPLVAGGKSIAVLDVVLPVLDPARLPRQEQTELLSALASQLAIALENARLFERTRAMREQLRLAGLSDFLSLVSHDLKTPLTTIKGYASTLMQDDVEWTQEEQQRFLGIIGQEADRLARRVQDLLDVSSIVSGSFSVSKSWCNVKDLIEVALEKSRKMLVDRVVSVDVPEGLPLVPVDAGRFKQVLMNLLDNAVKFSDAGGAIRVSARLVDTSVLVSVSDNGIGIDPADLPRIFDKFGSARDQPRRHLGSKGLGLAICQGIVRAHGGSIWADSAVGAGSTFTFSVPVLDGEMALEE